MDNYTLMTGGAIACLQSLPDKSVQVITTSPPYFGLRSYLPKDHPDKALEIGTEKTPEEFVAKLVAVFHEARRVLRDDGLLWVNIGDSFAGSGKGINGDGSIGRVGKKQATNAGTTVTGIQKTGTGGCKPKDLLGIPWMLAFALRADGWYLRADIVWSKPNPMPESVTDRCTKSHEYVFMLSKSQRYFYDQLTIAEPISDVSKARIAQPNFGNQQGGPKDYRDGTNPNRSMRKTLENFAANTSGTRNKRDVWIVNTESYREAHFATWPRKLVEPMILASTSPQACEKCGAPWSRSTAPRKHPTRDVEAQRSVNAAMTGRVDGHVSGPSGMVDTVETIGWLPTCTCTIGSQPYLLPDDLEIILTPTGTRIAPDPPHVTGRAGFNRLRGPEEGTSPITRYEQRKYAEQLRASPHAATMASEVGETTFAHYTRTDKSGGRPLPRNILASWVDRGWIVPVIVPSRSLPLGTGVCVVLDPFSGSGTTGVVALQHGRRYIGIDLNEEYTALGRERIEKSLHEQPRRRSSRLDRRIQAHGQPQTVPDRDQGHPGRARGGPIGGAGTLHERQNHQGTLPFADNAPAIVV